jgi:hypothetical protein
VELDAGRVDELCGDCLKLSFALIDGAASLERNRADSHLRSGY